MFPEFNIHSTPLLVLVAQGLIFAFLLLYRYRQKGKIADLLIGLILLIMAYHRTTYTIGFMGWYDTFKNTKINYYLVYLGLAMGPLIYLYVRTTLVAPFRLRRRDRLHFIPMAVVIIYRIVLVMHDAQLEEWAVGYEVGWMRDFHEVYVEPLLNSVEYSLQLVYLVFTGQLFLQYRKKVRQFFSNTYQVELNWIRNFLLVYAFLFFYGQVINVVDAFIFDMHYVHVWWIHLFSAIAIVYLGIKAYFTDLNGLHQLTFDLGKTSIEALPVEIQETNFSKEKAQLIKYIEAEEVYLNPDLTLKDLAKGVGKNIHEVSEIINSGFGVNFNELINQYRVAEVKKKLGNKKFDHLSLVAIAFDSGFRSKATFNRVFKLLTGQSPSQYKSIQNN